MRWGPITLILAVSLVVACGAKQGGLQPTSLSFADTYVGGTRSIDLSVFTLNGEPLKNPAFELRLGKFISGFQLLQGGALGTSSLLVFRPDLDRAVTQTLVVSAGGETFEVPVTGRGKWAPDCEDLEPDPCRVLKFSFTEEKCVFENASDGMACDASDCEGDRLCLSGVCTYTPRVNAPPVCGEDVAPVTALPAWTYEAETNRAFAFPGLVDAEGNLYLSDCERGGASLRHCDIVSVTADGQRRWRVAASTLPTSPGAPGLAIIDGTLFVSSSANGTHFTQAFRLTDGSLAWQRNGIAAVVPLSPGSAAAVLENSDPWHDASVLVLATDTGVEMRPLEDAVPGSTSGATVSDGNGRLYSSSTRPSPTLPITENVVSAVSQEQGRLWTTAIEFSAQVRATDGTRLFGAGDDVLSSADGQPLYAAYGIGFDLCLNSTQQAIFMTSPGPGMAQECLESNLRRLRLSDGVELSSCRLEAKDRWQRIRSQLFPTRDGGTIALVASISIADDSTTTYFLRWSDADGNAISLISLAEQVAAETSDASSQPAVVNGRWIMAGQRPSGRSAILAYDVPGLAVAEHGWLTPGGSQARNNAPW